MKYLLLSLFVFVSSLLMAQGLLLQVAQSPFHFQVNTKASNTFKKYLGNSLSLLPNKKKTPPSFLNLLGSSKTPNRKHIFAVKHSFLVDNIYTNQLFFQKNALTFRYQLSPNRSPKSVVSKDLWAIENNLVQGFVLVHPFVPELEKPSFSPKLPQKGIGVSYHQVHSLIGHPDKPQNKIYPNPTTGVFNIDLDKEATELKVTNLIGQVVLSQKIKSHSYHDIDISGLPKGTYIASFLQGEKWFAERVILIGE